ncbi:trypsin-like serine protease [Sphaerisporangium sp. NPDC004334]
MEPGRLADLRAGTERAEQRCGSGYLIGPSLVLTARHVVVGEAGGFPRIQVRLGHPRHGDGRRAPVDGTVCWQSPELDAALVRLARAVPVGGVRWGRLVGTEPVSYMGMGFPRFARYDDSGRGIEQLGGMIQPWSVGPDGCQVLDQDAAPDPDRHLPDGDDKEQRSWPGASGAAVLCSGLLIGVVARDDRLFGNRRLHARPVRDFVADAEFARLVRADTGSVPVVEPVELADLTDVVTTRLRPAPAETPGSLLAAAAEVVHFQGRGQMLRLLEAWRDGGRELAVGLVTAEGGQGKTRLARQFARAGGRAGWAVAFTVKPPPQPLSDDQHTARAVKLAERIGSLAAPVLIVCDYAEAHPGFVDALISALIQAPPPEGARVLLLARTAGDWWDGITNALGQRAERWRLAPLADTEQDRRELYRATVTDLADALPQLSAPAIGRPPIRPWPQLAAELAAEPPDLPPVFANALTLQMTALLDLLQAATGRQRTTGAQPEEQLVIHERGYLQRVAAGCGLFDRDVLSTATAPHMRRRQAWHALERCVAALVMLGPCDAATANALAALATPATSNRTDPASDRTADVIEWLRRLYPPDQGLTLGHIQPDRLAEHLLGGILTPSSADNDKPPAPGHNRLPTQIGALVSDLDTAQSALFALVRTAAHPAFAGTVGEQIVDLVVDRPDPFAAAASLLAAIPSLRDLLLAGLHQLATRDPHALSRQLTRTGNLLPKASVGLSHFSVAVTDILTTLYRALAHTDPDTYVPHLVGLMNNHALRLAEAGRRDEAFTVSAEAVGLCRELGVVDRDAYLSDLAASVNDHAIWLAGVGRRAEAVSFSGEAVGLYRELVLVSRDAYLFGLAASVNNHAVRLAEVGRRDEAVTVSEEAVGLCRELGVVDRDAYLPNLAASVNNHAVRLTEVGRRGEAVSFSLEAVGLRRELVVVSRDAYLPDLAMSMNNHATLLVGVGRRGEAVSFSLEAVGLYRKLVTVNRDAYLLGYIRGLTAHGLVLVEDDRFRESISTLMEAFIAAQELPEHAQGIIGAIVDLLHRAYAGDADGVAEEFLKYSPFPDTQDVTPTVT